MAIKESGEMYLESIYRLKLETGGSIRAIDIGEFMGYSKPSVSRALSILREDGFVTTDKDGSVSLTDLGLNRAKKIYERHTTISKFFVLLGVDPEIAAKDACKIEHVISDESFDALKKHIKEEEKKKS